MIVETVCVSSFTPEDAINSQEVDMTHEAKSSQNLVHNIKYRNFIKPISKNIIITNQ